jgi:hypothetical protein
MTFQLRSNRGQQRFFIFKYVSTLDDTGFKLPLLLKRMRRMRRQITDTVQAIELLPGGKAPHIRVQSRCISPQLGHVTQRQQSRSWQ